MYDTINNNASNLGDIHDFYKFKDCLNDYYKKIQLFKKL